MKSLGDVIRELRKGKKLTQDDLAPLLNVTRATLANWEVNRADPNLEDLNKIADFFNVSVDYLLGRNKYSIKQLELSNLIREEAATYTYKGRPLTKGQIASVVNSLEVTASDIEKIPMVANNESIDLETDEELTRIITKVIHQVREERGYKK